MDLTKLDHPLSSTRQLSGFWKPIGGTRFLLAPMNSRNRAFRVFGANHMVTEENVPQLLAEAIVLGWEGLIASGEPVEFSKETAAKVMELHPALADAILEAARELGDDEEAEYSSDIKELKNSRPGNGDGQAMRSTSPSPQEQEQTLKVHQA